MPSDGIHFLKEPHFYWPSLVAGEAELYIILAGYMAAQNISGRQQAGSVISSFKGSL